MADADGDLDRSSVVHFGGDRTQGSGLPGADVLRAVRVAGDRTLVGERRDRANRRFAVGRSAQTLKPVSADERVGVEQHAVVRRVERQGPVDRGDETLVRFVAQQQDAVFGGEVIERRNQCRIVAGVVHDDQPRDRTGALSRAPGRRCIHRRQHGLQTGQCFFPRPIHGNDHVDRGRPPPGGPRNRPSSRHGRPSARGVAVRGGKPDRGLEQQGRIGQGLQAGIRQPRRNPEAAAAQRGPAQIQSERPAMLRVGSRARSHPGPMPVVVLDAQLERLRRCPPQAGPAG